MCRNMTSHPSGIRPIAMCGSDGMLWFFFIFSTKIKKNNSHEEKEEEEEP